MSEAESSEFKGLYDQLSPKLVEKAYLENEAYDIRSQLGDVDEQVDELQESLRAEYLQDARDLVGLQDINHDDFLRIYQSILLKLDKSTYEVNSFNKMMELRTQLAPGVFVQTSRGAIATIAQSEDEDDENYGIRPKLNLDEGRTVRFYWSVPVEEAEVPLLLNRESVIGKPAIMRNLDAAYDNLWHREDTAASLEQLALNYDKIGEYQKAEALKAKIVKNILSEFTEGLFYNGRSDLDTEGIQRKLEILHAAGPSEYEDLLDIVRKFAAQGRFSANVLRFVKGYGAHKAEQEAAGDQYYMPSEAEAGLLYAHFAMQGEALYAKQAAERTTAELETEAEEQ